MKNTQFFHFDAETKLPAHRTGVSLHSHTLHSQECMDFIPNIAGRSPLLDMAIRLQQKRHNAKVDLAQAWWTPPLAPLAAWDTEARNISEKLGVEPLVSLSDHDNIDAANLTAVFGSERHPISIEWTVPFRDSFFHLGVHNLPSSRARQMVAAMNEFTENPQPGRLEEIFEWVHGREDVLIIFNHPCWDEKGVGEAHHRELVSEFSQLYHPYIDAIELNGMRTWQENDAAIELARRMEKPAISGGDRHGREPNNILNLTDAATFAEFVAEIRTTGRSRVVFMPHYREPHAIRVIQTICDVLRDDEDHALGWKRWSDRMFYRSPLGQVRSLTEVWGNQPPRLIRTFLGVMRLVEHRHMLGALRYALLHNQESAA